MKKKITIVIIVMAVLLVVAGYVWVLNTEKINFSSMEDCNSACINNYYDSGGCKWENEVGSYGVENLGSCLIENSKHCGNEGQCNCYCFEEQLIGGCAGVSLDYRQECCDNWALENDFVHIQCVGEWEIKNNTCSWRCQTGGQFAENVVDANNQFSFELYSKLYLEEGNLFFSPYSISSALAMTYEGGRGQTAEEMQKVLHLPGNKTEIRSGFVSIYNDINKADKPYKLITANALWAQKDYSFVQDYFDTVETYYDGKATNLDFKTDTENSRITINNWVEDKTNDKIKDLIPKGILKPDTRLVLTNAIYFKANWSNQFDVEDTFNQTFKLSSGTAIVKMMHKTSNYNYGETNNLQILEIDYLGNDLSMLIILPKNNIDNLESLINLEKLDEWKNDMKTEKVRVSLPKFKFETKYFMGEDLKQMGMPTAFKYPDADFTGISPPTAKSPNGELYIGEVIHQTFVEVAEYGTEAAAATAVIMPSGASPEQEQPKIFNADHPFIFIIQQKNTGNILFLGRVSDPSK